MAAAKRLQNIKAEVTCPICLELFWDPVTAECGHSFCRKCITRYREGDEDVACPQCKEKLRKRHLRPNRELRNIVEFLSLQTAEDLRGGHVCKRHRQPLQLYCKKDQTLICVVCERAQAHHGHTVVPVEEAVQEYWETITKHLVGIESTYGRLHALVSMDRKHLSPSAGEEVLRNVKRLAENMATLLKVDTEGPGQRFADAASQPRPRDPDWRGVSPGREADGETESQGPAGREPGSEPAAEKQEETGSHVGHVCEEAPTPKYGLDQTSLDPEIHRIKNTTETAESKVDGKFRSDSSQDQTSVKPVMEPAGSGQVGVSAVPVGRAAQGREGPGREVPEEQEATETPLSKEAATPSPGAGETQQDLRDASAGGADAPSRGDSPQGRKPVRPAQHSGRRRQVGVSPGERVALPPELQGCAVEVTLDPATAHPRLRLSEDRKSVRYGDTKQRLPNNPERFNISASVLGSEGFTSGRRYWEVEVGPKRGWAIGVARDSVQRKGKIQLKPDLGIWALVSTKISQVPRKVGVYLDYEGGEVRFYNAETMALISSRTATFTGRLVPFFYLWAVGSHLSLSLCQR